jgi:hypothetical protein
MVPDYDDNPHMEICHAFVYRWLLNSQKTLPELPGGVNKQTGPFNGRVMKPILWPQGGQPARVAGVNKVNAGDIVGFFDEQNGDLVHSMVAETPTQWVGANNTGCFGVPTGRTTIPNVYLVMPTPTAPLGWADNNGNLFNTMGGQCIVVFRTP